MAKDYFDKFLENTTAIVSKIKSEFNKECLNLDLRYVADDPASGNVINALETRMKKDAFLKLTKLVKKYFS